MLYSILLEITPRLCRINYQDSFHPHLPRANLPRRSRICARSFPREHSAREIDDVRRLWEAIKRATVASLTTEFRSELE